MYVLTTHAHPRLLSHFSSSSSYGPILSDMITKYLVVEHAIRCHKCCPGSIQDSIMQFHMSNVGIILEIEKLVLRSVQLLVYKMESSLNFNKVKVMALKLV